jgi:hypothetical protein
MDRSQINQMFSNYVFDSCFYSTRAATQPAKPSIEMAIKTFAVMALSSSASRRQLSLCNGDQVFVMLVATRAGAAVQDLRFSHSSMRTYLATTGCLLFPALY